MQKILLGTVIALGLASPALAQDAPASKPPASTTMTPPASTPSTAMTPSAGISADVRSRLSPGAQIYSGGKVVASVTRVETNGNVVISEAGAGGTPVNRILPPASLSLSDGRLATNLTAEQIKQLPIG